MINCQGAEELVNTLTNDTKKWITKILRKDCFPDLYYAHSSHKCRLLYGRVNYSDIAESKFKLIELYDLWKGFLMIEHNYKIQMIHLAQQMNKAFKRKLHICFICDSQVLGKTYKKTYQHKMKKHERIRELLSTLLCEDVSIVIMQYYLKLSG